MKLTSVDGVDLVVRQFDPAGDSASSDEADRSPAAASAPLTVTSGMRDRLTDFVRDLRVWTHNHGDLRRIIVAGGATTSGRERGSAPRSLDITGVEWTGQAIAPFTPRETDCCCDVVAQLNSLALSAMARRHFRCVHHACLRRCPPRAALARLRCLR